jgi:hypothetical protein
LLRRIADSFLAWPFRSAGVQIYTFLQDRRHRQAVTDANKSVLDAAIELSDAIKEAEAISYADVKAIKEKAKPGLDSYQLSRQSLGFIDG